MKKPQNLCRTSNLTGNERKWLRDCTPVCIQNSFELLMALKDLFIAAASECHRFLRRNVETLSVLFSLNYIVGRGGAGIIKGAMWKNRPWASAIFSPFHVTSGLQISIGTCESLQMQLQNIASMHCLIWGILARGSSRAQSCHDLLKIHFQSQLV